MNQKVSVIAAALFLSCSLTSISGPLTEVTNSTEARGRSEASSDWTDGKIWYLDRSYPGRPSRRITSVFLDSCVGGARNAGQLGIRFDYRMRRFLLPVETSPAMCEMAKDAVRQGQRMVVFPLTESLVKSIQKLNHREPCYSDFHNGVGIIYRKKDAHYYLVLQGNRILSLRGICQD